MACGSVLLFQSKVALHLAVNSKVHTSLRYKISCQDNLIEFSSSPLKEQKEKKIGREREETKEKIETTYPFTSFHQFPSVTTKFSLGEKSLSKFHSITNLYWGEKRGRSPRNFSRSPPD